MCAVQFALKLNTPHTGDTIKDQAFFLTVMGDELPILKGILNGVVDYHNARRCPVERQRVPVASVLCIYPRTRSHLALRHLFAEDFLTEEDS